MNSNLFLILLILGSCSYVEDKNWKEITTEKFRFAESIISLDKTEMGTSRSADMYKKPILVKKQFIIDNDTIEIFQKNCSLL